MKNWLPVLILLLNCGLAGAISAEPLIVAHRAGTADYPENTIMAIRHAIENKSDIIWLSVQLSKDNVVVLYRPSDLNSLTNGEGRVSQYTYAQLAQLDAAYHFAKERGYSGITIARLSQVLTQFPQTTFFIDIKAPDVAPEVMAQALNKTIADNRKRVVIYSTEKRYLQALPDTLRKFVDRDRTREALARILLSHQCILPPANQPTLYAFELKRKVEITEQMTLGEGRSMATMVWDKQAMKCFKQTPYTKVLLIGIDSQQAYQQAVKLAADYIMVDSPAQARKWRIAPAASYSVRRVDYSRVSSPPSVTGTRQH